MTPSDQDPGPCLERMVSPIADFFGVAEVEAREQLRRAYDEPGAEVAAAWEEASPQTPDEVSRFYQETRAYVFDLAADHCRERRRAFWEKVRDRLQRARVSEVLAYGDGIGTDSIALA